MRNHLGVWIDHAGATLVFLRDGEPSVERIDSNVEPRFRPQGGFRSKGRPAGQGIVSEGRAEARRERALQNYYRKVIKRFRDQDGVLLLGPGEAKLHLAKEARKQDLGSKLRATLAADKLTERQLIARVKEFFDPDHPSRCVPRKRLSG